MKQAVIGALAVLLVVAGLVGLNLYQAGRVSMMKEMLSESQDRERNLVVTVAVQTERVEAVTRDALELAQTTEATLIVGEGWLWELVSTPWRWYRKVGKKLKTEWAGLPPPPGVGLGGPEGEEDERAGEDETDFAGGATAAGGP